MSSAEVNGIGLAYAVAGDTGLPPVVLLHALGEDGNTWSTVVEALTPRYRTYTVDLRGHGGSSQPGDYSLELMRSDVLGFLRTLNLEEVTLIGHSLGGAVAYLVAEAEPGLVRQLVLEEPPPLEETPLPPVQACFGLAAFSSSASSMKSLLSQAEERLDRAKSGVGERVEI